MPEPEPNRCRQCGAALAGRFCAECGAPASRGCGRCGAEPTPGARFCHRCGEPDRPGVEPRKERTAWLVTGVVAALTVAVVAFQMGRGRMPAPTIPDMGNAGNAGPGGGVRAPDISRMSPRERFNRLFDRVVRAAETGTADTVMLFAPMALGAYDQLDTVDTDARYHAAMIHLVIGQLPEASALADTIETDTPGHLFATIIRGELAEARNDRAELARIFRAYLERYEKEMAAGRPEYAEHSGVIEDFRNRALATP